MKLHSSVFFMVSLLSRDGAKVAGVVSWSG